YKRHIKFLLIVIVMCFAVWATPASIIATAEETGAMGGSQHPILKYLGVMSAKNTAVNILILTTFLSFLFYRRGNKEPTVSWAKKGNKAQFIIFVIATTIVLAIGIIGYFVPTKTRIIMSVPQVLTVLLTLIVVSAIDVRLFKN